MKSTSIVEVTDIKPTNGRKSFYGKAKCIAAGGRRYLLSYSTVIGCIDDKTGRVHRYSSHRSKTTSAHVKAFFNDSTSFWSLPLEKQPKLAIAM